MKRLAAVAAVLSLLVVAVVAIAGDSDNTAAPTPEPERAAYTRPCGLSTYGAYPADKQRDAILGRVRIGAFRGNFENAQAGNVYQPKPGLFVLKAPIVFPGRRDVTISVPEDYRPVLTLGYKSNRSKGHPSVRFRSCVRNSGQVTGYAGGLRYTGPWPACVPVDVTVAGSPTKRHVLSLGAGRCAPPG